MCIHIHIHYNTDSPKSRKKKNMVVRLSPAQWASKAKSLESEFFKSHTFYWHELKYQYQTGNQTKPTIVITLSIFFPGLLNSPKIGESKEEEEVQKSHCEVHTGLELTIPCLILLSAGITGEPPYCKLDILIKFLHYCLCSASPKPFLLW